MKVSEAVRAVDAGREVATQPARLVKAACEFEALLLQNLLEKMKQSFVGQEDSQDAAHDTINNLGTQAVAGALVARGGIGIARMLLHQLEPAAEKAAEASTRPSSTQG